MLNVSLANLDNILRVREYIHVPLLNKLVNVKIIMSYLIISVILVLIKEQYVL